MARLYTVGAEGRSRGVDGLSFVSLAPTVDTAIVRSGVGSYKSHTSGGYATWPLAGVQDRWYYARAWFYLAALPSNTLYVLFFETSAAILPNVAWRVAGSAATSPGTLVAPDGTNLGPIPLNEWICLEIAILTESATGRGRVRVRYNGAAVGSEYYGSLSSAGVVPDGLSFGSQGGGNGGLYADDIAVNDDTGAVHNGWPGTDGHVLAVLPTSDIADGADWKLGNGATPTGNLWDAVNNTPPQGTVASGGTTTNQIRDAVAKTASPAADADFQLQSYAAAGVPTGSVVTVVESAVAFGTSTLTPIDVATRLLANPAQASETTAVSGNSSSTYPGGWVTVRSTVQSPGVALSDAPQLRIGKRKATTDILLCCFAGVMVEYATTPAATVNPDGIPSAQALGTPRVGRLVSPSAIAGAAALGTPTVFNVQAVLPAGVASAAAVGTPTVIGPRHLSGAGGIASERAVGTPVVAGPVTATGIASEAAVGIPDVSGGVRPTAIPSAAAVGRPTVVGGYQRFEFVTADAPQTTTNGVTRDFLLNVSGLGSILDVELSLYMTNPGGLSGNPVTLIAPNGRQVALTSNNGGGSRTATGRGTADQDRTHFDSEAAKAWGSLADAPWVGRFRPSGSLAALNGADPNGTWRLRVGDKKQGNTVNTIWVATLLLDAVVPLAPQTISVPSLPITDAVGTPAVSGPISPPSIASREAVGQPVIQQTPGNQYAVIFGLAIPSRQAIGRPVVAGAVSATSVASAAVVGTPIVDVGEAPVAAVIDAGAIASGEAFGGATLGQRATVVAPAAIASSTALGVATLLAPAPGAPYARRASWLWDPVANSRYDWPLNHSFEQPVSVARSDTRGAPRVDVGFARQQRPGEPLLLQLEGVILDPAQLAQLESFYELSSACPPDRPVVFHDADGDEYEVVITGFNARHVAAYNHGRTCYWTYALTLEVLDARAGAYEEIA